MLIFSYITLNKNIGAWAFMVARLTTLKKRTGFTIVELLVVIVIIGILATITVVSYSGITKKAAEATLQADLANASKQLKVYKAENDAYPTAIDCSATPAAKTICLKASSGGTFTYSANNGVNPVSFKLYETSSNGMIYKVTNNTSPALSAVPGVLTALVSPTISAGTNPYDIAISPDGASVYVTNSGSNTISMYSRDTSTGVLSALATPTISTGTKPYAIAISPDGTSVYATNFNSSTLSMYSRNIITGALTAMTTPTISTNSGPNSIIISRDGKFVYVNNYNSSSISMYFRNSSGILTALTPSFINIGSYAYQKFAMSPDDTFLYVTSQGNGYIDMYYRDAVSGLLSYSARPIANNQSLKNCAISPDGKSFYGLGDNGGLAVYGRNISDGILTRTGSVPAVLAKGDNNIIFSSDGAFAYATAGSNNILMYSRNTSNGNLTALPVPAVATDTDPRGIAISPDGNSVYTANYGSANVSMFSRE